MNKPKIKKEKEIIDSKHKDNLSQIYIASMNQMNNSIIYIRIDE